MILDARQVGWPRIPQPIDPPRPNMERPCCLICQVHSRESENARRSALLAAIYFSSKMRYYTLEKCNWSKLAERIGRNKWNFLWNAYLGHVWQTFRVNDCGLCAGLSIFIALFRAGWLGLYWRRENVSSESWPSFRVTEIQNNSTSATSQWSQCVKVKDARNPDVLKHLEDALHCSLII